VSSPEQGAERPRRLLVVLGGAREGGLCKYLADSLVADLEAAGAEWRLQDLLADGFDPVLRLGADERHATECDPATEPLTARYQADVRWADAYIIVHPVWWFAPPAILKGWVDRVFVHEVALRQADGGAPEGLLAGRSALVVQTFNAGRAIDRLAFLGISSSFWKRAVFLPVGIKKVGRLALYEVEDIAEARLARFCTRLGRAVGALASSAR